MRRGALILAGALLVLPACGGATEPAGQASPTEEPTPEETVEGGGSAEVEVEAEDFAFDPTTVTVPAGATVALEFKNRDEGTPHTFTLYDSEEAENQVFDTGSITGDAEESYEFTAPSEPGSYLFRCEVHTDMTGELVAE
jgi:plastocyanin